MTVTFAAELTLSLGAGFCYPRSAYYCTRSALLFTLCKTQSEVHNHTIRIDVLCDHHATRRTGECEIDFGLAAPVFTICSALSCSATVIHSSTSATYTYTMYTR